MASSSSNSSWGKRTVRAVAGVAGFGLGVYWALRSLSRPRPGHPYLEGKKPLVMAHRGGGGLWPENTMYAFERAVAMGVDALETDIHATADGEIVVMHDDRLERLTDGAGPIKNHTLAELKKLDAGYWWTNDGGKTYPYRGMGITIPTLEELFAAFPGVRINIDIKQDHPSIVTPFVRLLQKYDRLDSVMVGSFHFGQLTLFRNALPQAATAAGDLEVLSFYGLSRLALSAAYLPRADAFQIPECYGRMRIITPRFIRDAHAHNMHVHVWTVNEVADMRRLIDWGVDGIITDYPDRLLSILK